MDPGFLLIFAAHKRCSAESLTWAVIVGSQRRIFGRVRLVVPRRDQMNAHVKAHILAIATIEPTRLRLSQRSPLVPMVLLRLLLQRQVMLCLAAFTLFKADHLLSPCSIQTFVQHFPLVTQLMSML